MRKFILITGPGGRVGTQIVPLLRERFRLRLLDVKPMAREADDEVIQADIRDREALLGAATGVEALVHLAAISDEDDFYSRLLPYNLEGVYTAFEAARMAGVGKVIFPSTGQTVLNYPEGQRVTAAMPARPSTVYACTKLFGEALARHYSEKHGMSMICIRLCWFQPYDSPLLRIAGHRIQREWCSPRDLARLLERAIHSEVRFGVYFGLSNNRGRVWDISNAKVELGFEPEDNAANYLEPG
jgi:nucleoside-diphosphate-sugar epimerase